MNFVDAYLKVMNDNYPLGLIVLFFGGSILIVWIITGKNKGEIIQKWQK